MSCSRAAAVVTAAVAWLALAGCPRGTRKPLEPENGDVHALARFRDARAKFLRDGGETAEFQRIAEDYPSDPIVPWADLYAGIAAIKERKLDAATAALEHVVAVAVDPALVRRAQLYLGIADNYRGDVAHALPLLKRGEGAIEGDADRTEWLAAVAYATAAGPHPLGALPVFDQLWPRVTPTERAVITGRIEELVAAASADDVRRVVEDLADRKGPSFAIVVSRLALIAEETGNASEAARLRVQAAPARAAIGLSRTITSIAPAPGAHGDSQLLGAVVPLGGKQSRVGEAAVAGLGMAAGVADGKGITAVEMRSAADPDASAGAVDDLARANVVAIIGPIDGTSVDAAGARAESLGIPLIGLSGAAEKRTTGKFVFHIVHSAEARARVLAQRALAKGVRRLAVLAPDSGYGKAVSAAFADEVTRGGGTIVTTVMYPPESKSFAAIAPKVDGKWDGLFIPEQADRLGLITPALDAAGMKARPVGTKKVVGGRPVLLLSTAEGLTGAYLTDAGHHSEGALFAPGYYPDDQDPATKAFLERFIAAFGRAPGWVEAYAYDAAQLAAAASGAGRGGLAAALAKGELVGVTGTIRFDASHRRADAGVIYTVVEETGGVVAIRVAR